MVTQLVNTLDQTCQLLNFQFFRLHFRFIKSKMTELSAEANLRAVWEKLAFFGQGGTIKLQKGVGEK